jgi:dienelactone hydrolase
MTISAADGTKVYAELVRSKNEAKKGVVLMFHQAGSNRHEYDTIAPRIAEWGWDCLKVDQRTGGDMWGESNQTKAEFGEGADYEEAYADLLAALKWAEGEGYVWIVPFGSSYSASLALRLASESKAVDAVVAFSPGEYFPEKGVVAEWNSKVEVPVFIGATSEEMAVGDVYEIYDKKPDAAARGLDVVFGSAKGVHGASTLRQEKSEAAEEYWSALERFFKSLESGGKNFGG